MATVAELFVKTIISLDVKHVFGVTGGAIEPLFNELAEAESNGDLAIVLTRHEANAAFMASVYGKLKETLGVCIVTSGPGLTNTVTAIAEASDNYKPLLIISAQPSLGDLAKGPLQDSFFSNNTVDLLKPITKGSYFISSATQFPYILHTALMQCLMHPCGPVHISIPSDIFFEDTGEESIPTAKSALLNSSIEKDKLDLLADKLQSANQPVFVFGDDCIDANEEIWEHINKYPHAKIISSPAGLNNIKTDLRFQGIFGLGGHKNAADVLEDAETDLVLLIGFHSNVFSTGYFSSSLLKHPKLVLMSNDQVSAGKILHCELKIFGNINHNFKYLNTIIREVSPKKPNIVDPVNLCYETETYRHKEGPIKPQWLFYHLPSLLDMHERYVVDCGSTMVWAAHYLQPKHTLSYFSNYSFAPMTYSIGTSIGLAFADKTKPIVCILGDGSFLMGGLEITVAQEHELPIIFIVLNDNCFNMVRHGQKLNKSREVGFALPEINYAELASTLGITSYKIETAADLIKILPNLKHINGPILLDVYIDKEEISPMGIRIKSMQ